MIVDIRWPAETFLMRKIEALARCGYRITVVTPDGARGRVVENVRVMRVPGSRRGIWRAAGLLARALARDAGAAWRGLREAMGGGLAGWRLAVRRWAIAAAQPDVVHFEWTLAAVPCLPLLEGRRRWHAVVSCRGSHVLIAPVNPRRAAEAGRLRDVFQQSCRVHAVSAAILEEAAALGMEPGQGIVIRPAVDPALFVPQPKAGGSAPLQVMMTGALIWRKAMEYALLAFRLALDRGLEARLVVTGGAGKEERARFLYTVQDLHLEDRVSWLGVQPPEAVAEELRAADIFLHTSHSEGISNAVLEAMACGLPVACTDAGGMREAVRDGIDGFLVPVRDVEAMAEALVKLGQDAELRRRMGEAARERVLEEFTLERQTREWRALYEGLMVECRHGAHADPWVTG